MMQSIPKTVQGKILFNREVLSGHFHMQMNLPPNFPRPFPGQFVMIRRKDSPTPLLSRPMSIYAFTRGENFSRMEIFYRIAGEGTKALSCLKANQEATILGPLGRGFSLPPDVGRVILIAGGIGISPLTFLAASVNKLREGSSPALTAYIGAQHQGALAGMERFSAYCSDIRICTDDGSMGYRGTVIDLFERDFLDYADQKACIYACGPHGMMKCLAVLLEQHPLPCQVSVEERMACGLGACLGCAVAVFSKSGEVSFRRVCKDGPVFDIKQIRW